MDLYQVYEQDFVREVAEVWTHGFSKGALEVRPYCQHNGKVGECWSDFAWQADGTYASYVRHSAIVFICFMAVCRDVVVPSWLAEELAGIPAAYHHTGNSTERALESLRQTTLQSKQNRAMDPIMWDSLLVCSGFKNEKNVGRFVNQYNATVFYDQSLCFKPAVAQRQASQGFLCSPVCQDDVCDVILFARFGRKAFVKKTFVRATAVKTTGGDGQDGPRVLFRYRLF